MNVVVRQRKGLFGAQAISPSDPPRVLREETRAGWPCLGEWCVSWGGARNRAGLVLEWQGEMAGKCCVWEGSLSVPRAGHPGSGCPMGYCEVGRGERVALVSPSHLGPPPCTRSPGGSPGPACFLSATAASVTLGQRLCPWEAPFPPLGKAPFFTVKMR